MWKAVINGASGISAGYATEIPPHNIDGTYYEDFT